MDIHETHMDREQEPALELAMQELEALEAPGLWTAVGVSVGTSVASAVSYVGVTIAT